MELHSLDQLKRSGIDNESRTEGFIKNRYQEMEAERFHALEKARSVAALTIPALYPPLGWTPGTALSQPNQSLGSRGITNLASKICTTTFPSTADFFRTRIDPGIVEELKAADAQLQQVTQVSTLTMLEAKITERDENLKSIIRSLGDRRNYLRGLMHCLVSGTIVFFKPNLHGMKFYTLDQLVLRMDGAGECIELIVHDSIDPASFGPEQLKEITGHSLKTFRKAGITEIPIYMRQLRTHTGYDLQVEVLGKSVKSMEGSYDVDCAPLFVVPFFPHDGHSYALSYGELIFGNLNSLETTERAKNRLADLSAQCKIGLSPESSMSPTDWNLAVGDDTPVAAKKDDVTFLVAPVSQNLDMLMRIVQEQRQSSGTDFLLFSSMRRDAERVPTAEVLRIADELDSTLAGFFTELASTFQKPYLSRVTKLAEDEGLIQKVDKDLTQTMLTAGIETIQDNVEARNLDSFLARLLTTLPQSAGTLNSDEIRHRMAAQSRVPITNLFKSEEQLQQEQQQAQMMQFAQKNPQFIADQLGGIAEQQQQGGLVDESGQTS